MGCVGDGEGGKVAESRRTVEGQKKEKTMSETRDVR